MHGLRIGIDLGGTKTEIIALDALGVVRLRRRVASPQGDYAATCRMLVELVRDAEAELGINVGTQALSSIDALPTIGIGIPGAESRTTGLIKNANSTWLIGQPLRQDLASALGRPVRLANDANCFALSEASDGAAAGAAVVFGVILGTGVGGGIVVNGRVLTGANAIAGEWGHCHLAVTEIETAPVAETELPPCYCGRRGCVETYLSGPALARDHQRALELPGVVIPQSSSQLRDAAQIAAAAEQGDAQCEATLQRYEARLAYALAQVINVLDPEVIVLGGGLFNLDRLYVNVPRLWGAHVFSDTVQTRLLKNSHGDSSGVRGAAWLWP